MPEPYQAAGFRLVQLLGEHGQASRSLLRDGADGWLLVGEGVADLFDPSTLEQQTAGGITGSWLLDLLEKDEHAIRVIVFACWDSGRGCATPPTPRTASTSDAWDPASLNGDEAAWTLTRLTERR